MRLCSQACRRADRRQARELEQLLIELLERRGARASLCPSEVARARRGDDWRPLMEPVRRAARRLAAAGRLEITQGGRVVDPATCVGPIRLRVPR